MSVIRRFQLYPVSGIDIPVLIENGYWFYGI